MTSTSLCDSCGASVPASPSPSASMAAPQHPHRDRSDRDVHEQRVHPAGSGRAAPARAPAVRPRPPGSRRRHAAAPLRPDERDTGDAACHAVRVCRVCRVAERGVPDRRARGAALTHRAPAARQAGGGRGCGHGRPTMDREEDRRDRRARAGARLRGRHRRSGRDAGRFDRGRLWLPGSGRWPQLPVPGWPARPAEPAEPAEPAGHESPTAAEPAERAAGWWPQRAQRAQWHRPEPAEPARPAGPPQAAGSGRPERPGAARARTPSPTDRTTPARARPAARGPPEPHSRQWSRSCAANSSSALVARSTSSSTRATRASSASWPAAPRSSTCRHTSARTTAPRLAAVPLSA